MGPRLVAGSGVLRTRLSESFAANRSRAYGPCHHPKRSHCRSSVRPVSLRVMTVVTPREPKDETPEDPLEVIGSKDVTVPIEHPARARTEVRVTFRSVAPTQRPGGPLNRTGFRSYAFPWPASAGRDDSWAA